MNIRPFLTRTIALAAVSILTCACDNKEATPERPGTQQQGAGSHGNGHEGTGTNTVGGSDKASQ